MLMTKTTTWQQITMKTEEICLWTDDDHKTAEIPKDTDDIRVQEIHVETDDAHGQTKIKTEKIRMLTDDERQTKIPIGANVDDILLLLLLGGRGGGRGRGEGHNALTEENPVGIDNTAD